MASPALQESSRTLAFATNAYGPVNVAVDCLVSFTRAVRVGDVLTAQAIEENRTRRLAFCGVTVRNQDGETVCTGTWTNIVR